MNWKEIIEQYTRTYKNGRYDNLIRKNAIIAISDIKPTEHQIKNESYRSYNSYRHDLTVDTSLVKINETRFTEKDIVNTFYGIIKPNNDNINFEPLNYIYDGIVLNKNFSTNANEITLEDLFAEYGYDFIVAMDTSNLEHGSPEPFYLEYNNRNNENLNYSYTIIEAGNYYIDTTKKETDPDYKTIIEYDGTYCPTVQEILSGNLYIVIQSGNLEPKKIYFNNKFLPTIFINDDKYKNKLETYILTNEQTLKLCDICMFEKLGCQIKWAEGLIYYKNLYEYKQRLLNHLNDELQQKNLNLITQEDISFKLYLRIKYQIHNNSDIYYCVGTQTIPIAEQFESLSLLSQPENLEYYHLTNFNNDNFTHKISRGSSADIPRVLMQIDFGLSILLRGFYADYVAPVSNFELNWYYNNDNTDKYTIKIIKIPGSGGGGTFVDNIIINNKPITNNKYNVDIISESLIINPNEDNIQF